MSVRAAWILSVAAGLSLAGCSKPAATACQNGLKHNSAGLCVQCLANTDCGDGTYCDSTGTCSTCTATTQSCPCKTDTACPTGEFCSSGNTCQSGCRADSDCTGALATTCCGGVCTNTNTDAAANCGGCGNPACTAGDSCCTGACSDTSSDVSNCGSCGMACMNNAQCSGGQCQNKIAILGLFDATGNVENPGGAPTSVEVIEPIAFVEKGALNVTATGFCEGFHFDTSNTNGAALNAGTIGFSGYAGGDDASSNPVATQIQCAVVNGYYQCGFGALTAGVPGSEPAETPLTPLGGNTGLYGASASIAFSVAGGSDFGSYSGNQTPSTSYPVTEDLSAVTYTAGTDTVLNLNCGGDSSCNGIVVALVEATQNTASDFADPSPTFGYILCGAPFGDIPFLGNAGPAQITITGAAISSMLGSDTSLQTAVTTVFTLPITAAESLEQQDSEGNTVVPIAATASFGVAPIAQN